MTTDSIRINQPGKNYTGANEARLGRQRSMVGAGAWQPADSEAMLQVDFDRVYDLKEIRTQGSVDGKRFVARYFVFYTTDGEQWNPAIFVSKRCTWKRGVIL